MKAKPVLLLTFVRSASRVQEDSSLFTDGRTPERLRELADHASHLAASGCTESAHKALIHAAQEMRQEADEKDCFGASAFDLNRSGPSAS